MLGGEINREPEGGRKFWFTLFAGCFITFAGLYLFFSSPEDQIQRFFALGQAGVGTSIALTAAAELLPKEKRSLATLLRKLALTALALGILGAPIVFLV